MASQRTLLKRARRFDLRALEEIYDLHSPELYRYAWRFLGDEQLAEDCVAETFNNFLSALNRGGGPNQHLRAYLYRIAHNWISDYFRRRPAPEQPLDTVSIPTTDGEPSEAASREEEIQALRNALRNLTPNQRQVIMLKYLQGLDNIEIAESLEKPVGAVKALHHRGIQALKRQLIADKVQIDEP